MKKVKSMRTEGCEVGSVEEWKVLGQSYGEWTVGESREECKRGLYERKGGKLIKGMKRLRLHE